jgi:hypothetical protein
LSSSYVRHTLKKSLAIQFAHSFGEHEQPKVCTQEVGKYHTFTLINIPRLEEDYVPN